jgi:ATP-dependent exoDNAse (exonuclease V) alpha subunit
MGKVTLSGIRQQIAAQESLGKLIPVGTPGPHHALGRFATPKMLALEAENIHLAKGQAFPVSSAKELDQWGKKKGLDAEQLNAAQVALNSNSWTSIIEGFAGTAKTYTIGAVREFAESHDYIVRGFASTGVAAKALRDAGIQAQTIASLLAKPLPSPTGKELWFTDESSMLSTLNANGIIKAARELGIDRLVMVGDQGQHQSIEAGAPIRQLLKEGIPMATLQNIRRQQDPALRAAVIAGHEDGRQAFELLAQQGRITEIPDMNERYQRIADDYVTAIEAGHNTLALAPGNDERRAINATIRELLVERKHIRQRGFEHTVYLRRDFTPAQIIDAGSYREADIIHAAGTRNQQRQGIRKDSWLTVETVNRRAGLLTMRTSDGRQLEVSPGPWKGAAEVYTAEKRMLAVGDRLQIRHPDKPRDIANAEFATIIAINSRQATLRFHGKAKREVTLPLSDLRHVDYGYAVTSFSSQGSTVDTVVINEDSMRSARLVNREQLYVSESRARLDVRVYTDDVDALRQAVARDPKKAIALDAVKQLPTQQQQQKQAQSVGIQI